MRRTKGTITNTVITHPRLAMHRFDRDRFSYAKVDKTRLSNWCRHLSLPKPDLNSLEIMIARFLITYLLRQELFRRACKRESKSML